MHKVRQNGIIIVGFVIFIFSIFFLIEERNKVSSDNILINDISSIALLSSTPLVKKDNDCVKNKLGELSKEKIFGNFEKFPVFEKFNGEFVNLDIESSFIAKRFKTTINDALSKNEVNFAGHYVIAEWGFTGVGGMMAVIDVVNGKAYPFPYINKFGLNYRSDSNLIIVDSLPILTDSQIVDNYEICPSYSEDVRPYYFVFENNTFRLLGPKNSPFPQESDWMKP